MYKLSILKLFIRLQFSGTLLGRIALSQLVALLLALFFCLNCCITVLSNAFWEPAVYLQLHHQFLLIHKLWKTGWVLLLQVTYVIKLFLEIALLASNLMLVFYINSLPVPHSPFHGAFGQEKLLYWFFFTHCWLGLVILLHTHLFVQLFYLLFQLRNALGFELFVQFLV